MRLRDQVPHGHWTTQTFLAALRCDRVTATFLLNGPINGQALLIYVERVLLRTLKPDDIVVMDNLGSHKSRAVRDAIRSVGAHRLFLPAYLQDLNPMGQMPAQLKALLRKARARTFDDISGDIKDFMAAFTTSDCANYLENTGYASI